MKQAEPLHFNLDNERTKLHRVVVSRKLGGLANDTKWKELVESCYSMNWVGPFYRYKCIDNDYVSEFNIEWHAIPQPFMAIEWLDIQFTENIEHGRLFPKENIDHIDEIESVLHKVGFDFKKGKECFRVFGYVPRNKDGFI